MAWETRGLGRYYYSSRRRGGSVEKIYHGPGVIGELAAGVIAGSKRKRAEQARALAAEKARLATVTWAMTTLDEACRLMLASTLTLAGFHQHARSWRRRRVRIEDR